MANVTDPTPAIGFYECLVRHADLLCTCGYPAVAEIEYGGLLRCALCGRYIDTGSQP